MATKRTKQVVWAGAIIAALLAGAVSVSAFSLGRYEKVKASGPVVSIPVSRVADNKAHFYRYDDNGKAITFFVVKTADNSFRSAFDACDSCFQSKKGYEQNGDKMICKNCNQKFAINRLGPNATGGCNPGYLPLQLNGSSISISVNDLKGGARYF